MHARRPTPRREPALENLGQQIRRCRGFGFHALEVRRRAVTVEGSGGNSTLPSHVLGYWLTGFVSRSQSLPLKVPMNSVLIGE